MLETVKYKKEHMQALLKDGIESYLSEMTEEQMGALEFADYIFTLIRKSDNKVVACGGIANYWPGRGEIWGTFSKDCQKEFIAIHRFSLKIIREWKGRRIEAAVATEFSRGHRWMRALGFKVEAPLLKSYLPNGGDVVLYSIIK